MVQKDVIQVKMQVVLFARKTAGLDDFCEMSSVAGREEKSLRGGTAFLYVDHLHNKLFRVPSLQKER